MLDELRIRGLGVIDEATLPLGPGLTVVTGETGAGKTMVVTGLLLLFGGRADPARVRNGADLAEVDGRLRVPAAGPAAQRALDAGGRLDVVTDGVGTDSPAGGTGGTGGTEGADGTEVELVLRRTVSSAGRSRAYVGGVGAPVAVLGELAERLVAVHGQSDQLRLSRPGAQRGALDRFAGIDTSGYAAAYAAWRAATAELDDRTGRAAQLRREADLLAHGLREIDAVAPVPGEAEDLAQLAARLGAADALTHAARTAHDALLGESDDSGASGGDVAQLLASAARIVGQQRTADPEFGELAGRLDELALLAADLGADFGAYADALDADPGRLEQVESRRAALQALLRKYCDDLTPSTAGVLRWADDARARLAQLDVSDEALARLRAALGDAAAATAAQAQELSRRRKDAASALGAAVTGELAGLAMADARLDVEVARRAAGSGAAVLPIDGHEVGVGPDGADDVTFLLQPHPGAPPLPIARGASGGELSRVMLALEVCLGRTDPVPTMVFDEVDAGVGGRAAVEVGRRLARLARERQVLVVTHLPQVAAFADRHVVVDKPSHADAPDTQRDENGAGVTVSDIRVVSGEHRVAELARMLAGSDTPTARRHAAELLADAAAHRASDSS